MLLSSAASNVTCPRVADLALVIDHSTSVVDPYRGGFDNWQSVLNFTKSIAGAFSIGPTLTQVGLIGFSTVVRIEFYLNTYDDRESLLSAIDNIEIRGGGTRTVAALRRAREDMFIPANGARNGVPRILILLTDGVDNVEYPSDEPRRTKDSNIKIYVVGVADWIHEREHLGLSTTYSCRTSESLTTSYHSSSTTCAWMPHRCRHPTTSPPLRILQELHQPPLLILRFDLLRQVCSGHVLQLTTADTVTLGAYARTQCVQNASLA